jgi:hypothetical protein
MREKSFVEIREHRELHFLFRNRDDDQRRDCQPDYQQNNECEPLSRDDPLRRLLHVFLYAVRNGRQLNSTWTIQQTAKNCAEQFSILSPVEKWESKKGMAEILWFSCAS